MNNKSQMITKCLQCSAVKAKSWLGNVESHHLYLLCVFCSEEGAVTKSRLNAQGGIVASDRTIYGANIRSFDKLRKEMSAK